MAEWYTTLDRACLHPELARAAMTAILKIVDLEGIPRHVRWSASVRPFGIVVFAEWGRNLAKESTNGEETSK